MTRKKPRGRASPGDGSVYQRADGMWIGAMRGGSYPNGKRRRIVVSAKTEELVRKRLLDKQRALAITGDSNVNPRDTIKTWAKTWLEIQELKLRPKSFSTTRSAVNKWIVPTIGHVRFDSLAPAHIRAVRSAQRSADLTTTTQLRTHSVLTRLLTDALLEGYPVTDRVFKVDKPEIAATDRAAMSLEEALAILDVAATTPQGSRWVAAFLQGMRQNECLGLTWDAIDFDHDEITLSWQLQAIPYRIPRDRSSGFRVPDNYDTQQVRGQYHLVRPKTKTGWRVIPMVAMMRTALEGWRDRCPSTNLGLVWPLVDGRPCPSKIDDEEWYGLQQAADVHHPLGRFYTVNEARHTTITLLSELNIDREIIAAIVGQSKLVESYLHVKRSPRVRAALESFALELNPGRRT